ncbi:MAG: F0F1 ATP synthase subunit B [bacterium]
MLGFNFVKFLFSILNFVVLMILLKKFFFQKILDILEERKAKVAAELATADAARAEVAKLRESGEKIVLTARQEGEVILKKARETADQIIAQAKAEAAVVVQEAKAGIEREKEEIRREMYSMLVDLVSLASRKVMYGSINEDHQKALIESAVGHSLRQSYLRGGMTN